MGSGGSTQNSRGSSSKAEQGGKIADEILTLLLANASFTKLLSLHNLDSCPKFIFSTAKELESKFQKLKIYPERGANGEILFAAVSELSPGLEVTGNKNTTKDLDKIKRRNELCIDIAYYYIRAFQVYMALAMTTLNAFPTRTSIRRAQAAPGPVAAPMVGGALAKGALTSVSKRPVATQVIGTVLEPLKDYFTAETIQKSDREFVINLEASKYQTSTKSVISLLWLSEYDTQPSRGSSTLVLKGAYRGGETNSNLSLSFKFIRRNERKIDVEINDNYFLSFVKPANALLGKKDWGMNRDNSEEVESEEASDIRFWMDEFVTENIDDLKSQKKNIKPAATSSYSQGSSYSSSVGTSITGRGQTSFEGFDSLKKVFESYRKGERDFPKAYCIARAMALLNPCFPSEKVKGIQYESQVCRSTFDFEEKEKYLPREGSEPKRNIYLQSLISLYYDSYSIKDGKAVLSQTEDDRTNLRKASALLADLYLIETYKEEFIGDPEPGAAVTQHRFKSFEVCQKKELYIGFNEAEGAALVSKLQSECINPMIKFQEEHTVKVNNLLSRMFEIKRAGTASEIKFSPALKGFGVEGVNKFAREARTLLLGYYLKSEAYYVRGVRFIAEYPKAWNSNPAGAVKK